MKLDKNEVFVILAYVYDRDSFRSQYFLGVANTISAARRLAVDAAEKNPILIFSPPDIVWARHSHELLDKGRSDHIHILRETIEMDSKDER